jgi:predicted ATPase/serine/threonine protein kinase
MFAPDSHLGRYTIRERLGSGGMGDVYLALDPTLGRKVAVKVLPDDLSSDSARLARFVREARTVSALNHPNILTVHDFGQEGATHFLVTELVDGRTLRAWHAEARPPLVEVLGVMAQAATALAAAHEAGVVHRDVKPENLMLRRDGIVKVLDFGIAKLTSRAFSGLDTSESTAPGGHTAPGTILGTVRYMSPEQAAGLEVDARTDVWSLGVVLYELVAGRPPFKQATPMGTLAAILEREPVPLAEAAPGTPEVVCRVVAKALRKRREERYETAGEMAEAFERARLGLVIGVGQLSGQEDAETMALVVAVDEAGEGEKYPPEPSATLSPTNLPPLTSTLIGRDRELADVTGMLRGGDVRLLTLTGAGGTGKTRLAVEAGRLLLDSFSDGVFVVELSTVADPAQLAATVAGVFGLKESAGSTVASELEGFLADKRLLLVLDNFEQLVAGVSFVSEVLAAAPGVRVLVTSQAVLRLREEREYALEPLAVPAFATLPPLDELARTPAVALFMERARAARPSFALTAENARVVVEICRKLDGLPLALELAAARVKLMSPAAMLERLDQRLKLLKGGARDLPARQQTMRGAVAWSYDLLDEAEKAVLRRLGVFAGGWTLEAAEAAIRNDECGMMNDECQKSSAHLGVPSSIHHSSFRIHHSVDVIDVLGSLVDKSLIRQRELEDGEVRFSMLSVVREFALEQLEASGEADNARLAHGRYFLRLAEEAGPGLRDENQSLWLKRLRLESDNLVAAVSLLLDREPENGAALVIILGSYSLLLGFVSQKRTWCLRALEAEPAPEVRAELLHQLSNSEVRLGNARAAVEYARQAVEASREHGERRELASTLNGLGQALLKIDDTDGARKALEEGLPIARELGDRKLAILFLDSLGEVERSAGDLGAARAAYEQALEEGGRTGSSSFLAVMLLNLGSVSLELGDLTAAAGFYRESLARATELGEPALPADAVDGLGAVALEQGDLDRAARLAGVAEVLYESAELPREPYEQALRDRYVAALRASLDDAALEREWTRGRAMTLDEAVQAALGE